MWWLRSWIGGWIGGGGQGVLCVGLVLVLGLRARGALVLQDQL